MPSQIPSNAIPLPLLQMVNTSFTSGYQLLGQFTQPVELLIIMSTLNVICGISFDGVHEHVVVSAWDDIAPVIPLEFKANLLTLPATSVYVNAFNGAPASGAIYVMGFTAQTP